MNAACQLLAPGNGEGDVDPDTGEVTPPAPSVVWEGACRVQAAGAMARRIEQAVDQVTVRGYLVQLADTDANPVPDVSPEVHTLKVTQAVNDAHLAGRALSIVDVQYGSERFTRDLLCDDNLG